MYKSNRYPDAYKNVKCRNIKTSNRCRVLNIHTHIQTHTLICINTCINIHTCTHPYMHTHTDTYTKASIKPNHSKYQSHRSHQYFPIQSDKAKIHYLTNFALQMFNFFFLFLSFLHQSFRPKAIHRSSFILCHFIEDSTHYTKILLTLCLPENNIDKNIDDTF